MATSAPPAGIVPIGNPIAVPRSQGLQDLRQSDFVIQDRHPRVTGITSMPPCRSRAAM